jgi:hypothetical protein
MTEFVRLRPFFETAEDILCDVDGVLADMAPALLAALGSTQKYEQISRHDTWLGGPQFEGSLPENERQRAWEICDKSSFWENLPIAPGALELIQLIDTSTFTFRGVTKPARLHIVTSPWKSCVGWYDARIRWLESALSRKRGPGFVFAPIGEKHHYSGDILFEDRLETVLAWSKVHSWGDAFLIDRPWNRHATTEESCRFRRIGFVDSQWVYL